MVLGLLKMLKDRENAIRLNRLKKQAKKVLVLDESMRRLSDEELRGKTLEFKERLSRGETLDDLLSEAFAVVREASARVLGMKHYPVQVMGGIVLHEGNIAEMATGEGKTLVATLPAYLNALTGKGVHVVTVNEYLAKRDHDLLSPLYNFLGLSTGVVLSDMETDEKQKAYRADVVYTTNSEVGFDYLRDHMVYSKNDKVLRGLHYCIVDEVDSVLLDDARTPLIISGEGEEPDVLYHLSDLCARTLKKGRDFTVDEESRTVSLTEEGVARVEEMFRIDNIADPKHAKIRFHVDRALQAHYIMRRDKDYIIANNEIKIIDENTGRISEGRRFSYGLHQALEAKEGVKIRRESKTLASITYQNFFLLYEKLAGMTGTAKTAEEEFKDIYNLDVITIPTNKPVIRKDLPDKLYLTKEAKLRAIVRDVRECYGRGQPVLIGTSSIEKSEQLSKMLADEGIPHVVLNAKNHAKEAEIVARAGQKGSVTIATNMAGRGTDIKLGEGVKELGGLKVIGTERAMNRRIDNQLRGRAGRQGDPGMSQFYLSFDDDLLRIFAPESVKNRLKLMEVGEDEPIDVKFLINSIHSAQARIEGTHFDIRKQTIEYDAVDNQQRTVVYEERDKILEPDFDVLGAVQNMTESVLKEEWQSLKALANSDDADEDPSFAQRLQVFLEQIRMDVPPSKPYVDWVEDQTSSVEGKIRERIRERVDLIRTLHLEEHFRLFMLQTVDQVWQDHLMTLDYLRDVVRYAGYKQVKPIDEYSRLAYEAFSEAMKRIQKEVARHVLEYPPSDEIGEKERETIYAQ